MASAIQVIGTTVKTPTFSYQNANVGGTLNGYSYLPFIYQGAARTRTGDNLQAALVLASNKISVDWVQQLVQNRATLTVQTYLLEPGSLAVIRELTKEIWLAASYSYDDTTCEMTLSSGIDAVGSQAPTRVLTRAMVGALPTTGAVQNL